MKGKCDRCKRIEELPYTLTREHYLPEYSFTLKFCVDCGSRITFYGIVKNKGEGK